MVFKIHSGQKYINSRHYPIGIDFQTEEMSFLPIIDYESPELYTTLFTENLYKIQYLNPKGEISLEGNNVKNILIVVSEPFNPSDQSLLFKIMKSIQLELSDIHILKAGNDFPLGIARVLKIYNPSKMVLFGAEPGFMNISENAKKYQIMEAGSVRFLLADSLSALETDPGKTLKNLLWAQLKILFL